MKIVRVGKPGKLSAAAECRLNALDAATFTADPPYGRKRNAYWWIAVSGGLDVAFAGLEPLGGDQEGCALLCRCGVVEGFRGAGLQRRLLRVRERAARKLGYERLLGFTARDNYASANNFASEGFKLCAPWASWCGDDGIYVHKPIQPSGRAR